MKKYNKIFILFIVALSLFITVFFRIENDYFWHIKAGEYMFKHHILTKDIFSWFVSGKYWMSHEWLFEIILYIFKVIFKNYHTLVYIFLCNIILLLAIFLPNKNKYLKNIPLFLIMILFYVLIILPIIACRPHMLSFIFFTLTFYLAYDYYEHPKNNKIFFIPLITIFWTNMHGGSSNLSYLLPVLMIIGGLFSFKSSKIYGNRITNKQILTYSLVILLSLIAITLNPHGIKMLTYPYENMLNTTMLNNISEWQPTTLNNAYHLVFFIYAFLIVLTIVFSTKKIKWLDFILLTFSLYLGLKSIRFWMYTYIILNYIFINYIKALKPDKYTDISLILFSSILLLIGMLNFLTYKFNDKLNLSNNLIKTIKKESPKRLYNMYDFGGELIYHDILVFIDGRADLYSNYNYKDYLNISKLENNYLKKIKKYNFDYFLVLRDYPLNSYLSNSSNYKEIYKNKKIILYKKIASLN